MDKKINKYLVIPLLIGIVYHTTCIFFTLEYTYDALIHLFFANHYASSWFEPWNYKWYTGFTVMSYPPLVHQVIGFFSFIGGLKFGLFTVSILTIILFITGVYRFSLLMTGHKQVAGYATILAVFSSSFTETLHVFGQLPSIVGISVLMHALPEIYIWIKKGSYRYFFRAIAFIAITVTSHHVTPIFGMIFFFFPLIGMVIMDKATEEAGGIKKVTIKIGTQVFFKLLKRILFFGFSSLVIIIICILPYWINTKNNPITQVPIPHGSRDNFLEVASSGLVFFLIPWGILLFLLPYIFYRYYSKRYLFFGLSITMLTILGTGGTTPVPKMLLGNNTFNILTLDRFTLWASIMALPMFGEFVFRFTEADLKHLYQKIFGTLNYRILGSFFALCFLFISVFSVNLGYFRPSQPQKIKMLPVLNFLNQDQHDQWRYLTLGFGDQIAWLGAQTNAMSIDGNYHSARRLPELTTRAIERLENSKFKGIEGLGSLQQFLTVPEKYNLKYIFSNDKFYDPILYFTGWQRLRQLENGIMVWERLGVPPLSTILPKDNVPEYQKIMWGLVPFLTVLLTFFIINIQAFRKKKSYLDNPVKSNYINFKIRYQNFSTPILYSSVLWGIFILSFVGYKTYHFYIKNKTQLSPQSVVKAYFDALDFKQFERAHSFIDPKSNIQLDQYMLEIAVRDGLLSSYAKLDAITVNIKNQTLNRAKADVFTKWITPLERIERKHVFEIIKRKNKWYVTIPKPDSDLPPDQLMIANKTSYFNHGRRRITAQQMLHEDILKQPVLEILKAKLIKKAKSYSVIGTVQNVDNVPADVVLKATLYDKNNRMLASFNAKYHIKHKLMPKETTDFRIDFEGIAWSKIEDSIPETFNPDEFTPTRFEEQPIVFNLHCESNVAKTGLYKEISINAIEATNENIRGNVFNTGTEEATITQLLVSYYNERKELIWVDHSFLKESVRQQRKQNFNFSSPDLNNIYVIFDQLDFCFVNGLSNKEIAKKMIPERNQSHINYGLLPVKGNGFSYLKIETDNYIGNPD